MLIAQEISRRMKSELGITVSVGVSFNKIFAKLGSDYKKPDAITTMYKSEFKQKAWSLPVADLLYVGKSTNRKLALFGIKTIGDLARADEDVLNSHLERGAVSYGRLLMAMMIHLSSWRTPTLQSNPWGTAQRHQRI